MEFDEQPQWFGYFPYKVIRSRGSLECGVCTAS